jgi:signal transduction histidine kinase
MARSFNTTAGALMRGRQRQREYVATAMHALRTPLTTIQLAVGYISPDRPLPPEPRMRGLLDLIGRQLVRLNGLVGDILNATWIDAGELPLLMKRFDLRSIAVGSVKLFQSLSPEHVFHLSMPDEPLDLQGDRSRLEQVLNNLLSNAVKYSPLGSRVEMALSRAGDDLLVEVRDQGKGIAPEDRARIFQAFERGSATHEQAAGSSLGLWVSRRVIEAHGGHIELDSRVGRGSTFRVILPGEPLPEPRFTEESAQWPPYPGA